MAQPTYDARVVVLRKTKLKESDLILTLLAQDGSQLRAVAKGARKPTSSFAARLELYSVADVLLAGGKSLDIVKEARLVESNERARRDLEHAAAAAPMAELLGRVTVEGQECPRLFDLTCTALACLGRVDARTAPTVCAAQLLKTFAFVGLRPSFGACVGCGRTLEPELAAGGTVWFSYGEGGAVCPACRPHMEALAMPAETLACAHRLMHATFSQIESEGWDLDRTLGVLQLCQQWSREHVGARLRSLDFLFTSGLF